MARDWLSYAGPPYKPAARIYLRGVLVGQNKLTMVTLESRRERSSSETRYCESHARIAECTMTKLPIVTESVFDDCLDDPRHSLWFSMFLESRLSSWADPARLILFAAVPLRSRLHIEPDFPLDMSIGRVRRRTENRNHGAATPLGGVHAQIEFCP